MFVHHDENIYISVYVDDIALYASPSIHLTALVDELKKEFDLTDMGTASWLLGIHITYSPAGITLSQHAYIEKVLKRFDMDSSRPVSTPLDIKLSKQLQKGTPEQQIDDPSYYQSIIGSLMYAVTGTRPNLAHTISLLSHVNSYPNESHLTAVKHVLQYIGATQV